MGNQCPCLCEIYPKIKTHVGWIPNFLWFYANMYIHVNIHKETLLVEAHCYVSDISSLLSLLVTEIDWTFRSMHLYQHRLKRTVSFYDKFSAMTLTSSTNLK